MDSELIIDVIAFVVVLYFACRPRPKKKKVKDKLTKEIRLKGMPTSAPWNGWIPPH